MKTYNECEYTYFFSYSGEDDIEHNRKIRPLNEKLNELIRNRVRKMVPDYKEPSEYRARPIVSGQLNRKLTERLENSYSYIAVIDNYYLDSDACMLEYDYIRKYFADENADGRVFLIVLSVEAEKKLHETGVGGFALIPLHNHDPEYTLGLDDHVHKQSRHIADSLFKKIVNDKIEIDTKIDESRLTIAVAPVNPVIESRIHGLEETLKQPGHDAEIKRLAKEDILENITEQGIRDLDYIVQPFSDQAPLSVMGKYPGGLIEILEENLSYAKATEKLVLWYIGKMPDPVDETHPSHEFISVLKQRACDENGLLEKFSKRASEQSQEHQDSSDKAIVYIETNENTNERYLWQNLEDCMREKWYSINKKFEQDQPLKLVVRPWDSGESMDQNRDNKSRNIPSLARADGVVLLWGECTEDNIMQNIDYFEDHTEVITPMTPASIIAYLIPPNKEKFNRVAMEWPIANIKNDRETEQLIELDDPVSGLERFLVRVRKRRRLLLSQQEMNEQA